MNKIRLFRYFFSEKLSSEFILFIQLFLMLFLMTTTINPFVNFLQQYRAVSSRYLFDTERAVHVSVETANLSEEEYESTLRFLQEREGDRLYSYFLTAAFPTAVVGEESDQRISANNTSIIYYSTGSDNLFHLRLSETFPQQYPEAVHVAITKEMQKYMEPGKLYEVWMPQLEENDVIHVEVTAYIDDHEILPVYRYSRSLPVLSEYGMTRTNETATMVVLDGWSNEPETGNEFLILKDSRKEAQETAKALGDELGDQGWIRIMGEGISGSWETFKSENASTLFALILLTAIGIFGYGSYIYVLLMEKEKTIRILHMYGMTTRAIRRILILKNLCWILVIYGCMFLIFPKTIKVFSLDSSSVWGPVTILIPVIFVFLVQWLFVTIGFTRVKKELNLVGGNSDDSDDEGE